MATNVLRFPSEQGYLYTEVASTPHAEQGPKAWWRATKWFLDRVVLFVCIAPVALILALIWPLLRCAIFVVKWVAIIACGADLLYQFFAMLYHWHTPGMHPGWTFLLHYGVITAVWTALYSLQLLFWKTLANRPRR
ncbi:MAG: KleE stable inheritance protein [Syntrophobacteraceae bacterium]